MTDENKIRQTIASNLVHYRKLCNYKQSYVAEKIGYSDKAISKWERGEGVPDIYVLYSLAEIYGVKVSDLLAEKKLKRLPSSNHNKILVTFLSVGLTWLIATIVFVFMLWFGDGTEWFRVWCYMPFIYAIPVSFIIMLVFNKIGGKRIFSFFIVSALIWTIGLSLERSFYLVTDWAWLFYILCVPLQILTCFWYLLKRNSKHGYSSDSKN